MENYVAVEPLTIFDQALPWRGSKNDTSFGLASSAATAPENKSNEAFRYDRLRLGGVSEDLTYCRSCYFCSPSTTTQNHVSRGGFAAYADLLAVTIFLSRFPTAVEQAMKPLLSLCAADRIYHV
jgi:hypothetical protein